MRAEFPDLVPGSLSHLANRFGTDKGTKPGDWGIAHGYAAIYERFLGARRLEPLRLLELGVWKGASLRMWESYLPNAQIIGIDNLSDTGRADFTRADILIGDATDQHFLQDAVRRFAGGKIDIVIDDASHVLDQQVLTLEALFPLLDDGGLYFVEDVSGSRFKDGNPRRLPRYARGAR
jgi:Methyltransferase domain